MVNIYKGYPIGTLAKRQFCPIGTLLNQNFIPWEQNFVT